MCLLLSVSLLASCGGGEPAYFDHGPSAMYLPQKHGYLPVEGLGDDGFDVLLESGSYRVDGVSSEDRAEAPSDGSCLLIGFSWITEDSTHMRERNFFIPDGGNAARIGSILDKDFNLRAVSVSDVCVGDLGIQIERQLPGGEKEYYFASQDGYLFRPVVKEEYDPDVPVYLSLAVLPSGFAYAEIGPREFSVLAALEYAYYGRNYNGFLIRNSFAFEYGKGFLAGVKMDPEEYPSYGMCISNEERHLDLSYPQAAEFLDRYLGWDGGPVVMSDPVPGPFDAGDFDGMIRIAEYSDLSDGTEYYLLPSGRLARIKYRRGFLINIPEDGSPKTRAFVTEGLLISYSENTFDYAKALWLLSQAGEPNETNNE